MITHKDIKVKFKYINEIFGCACFPDIMALKIFPDGKEITESMSAYNFFRNYQDHLFELKDPSVSVVVVGDGCTPRTASMFAFRTAWSCYSIDPEMKWRNNGRVNRLTCIKERIENLEPYHFDKLVLIHIHSHAKLEDSVSRLTANKRVVLSMPCCVKQERERPPDYSFIDEGIWSPKNKVDVWVDF